MSTPQDKERIKEALEVSANKGQISQQSKSVIIANLDATNLPGCIGASTDTLGTTYPSIVKLVVDASGSMDIHRWGMIDALNRLKDRLMAEVNRTGAEVLMSVTQFDDRIKLSRQFEHVDQLVDFEASDYEPGDLTALFDAAFQGIVDTVSYGSTVFGAGATGNQQIVIILSDGADNASAKKPQEIADFLYEFRNKRNFVIAFIGFGDETFFRPIAESMGVPAENIRTYDPNQPGFLDAVMVDISSGVSTRSKQAGMGQVQSGDFFVT